MTDKKKNKELKKTLKDFLKVGAKSIHKFDKLNLKDFSKGFIHKDAFYHVQKGDYVEEDLMDDNFIQRISYGVCSYDIHNHDDEHEHDSSCSSVYRKFGISISISVEELEFEA